MAASNEPEDGRIPAPPGNASTQVRLGSPTAALVIAAIIGGAVLWFFPLFRIVPVDAPGSRAGSTAADAAFDPATVAAKLWATELPAAAQRAADVSVVVPAIRMNPEAARKQHARASGLGTAYYFVRGSGKVVSQDRNYVRIALDLPQPALVALRVGPVFGNTVRDGCGLLDVNKVPGLQEFNALSAELNTLVEKNVLPTLRERASIGATVMFAGCAEAPETAAAPDEPLLVIVPVTADVRR